MKDHNKEKRFIDLPEYPGGKNAFQEFIRKNLKYPAEAIQQKTEGTVHVKYRVDGQGKVIQAEVSHGIGHGCDEEALRLVKLLKYGRAKNRGLRVTASMRTKINFKLPQKSEVQYNYVSTNKPKPEKKQDATYGYTITVG
jgi:protein TonB